MNSTLLRKNVSFMVLLQLVNYAAPLLVVPYLSRNLGVAGYGEVAVALAFIQACVVVTDFGLSMLAPAEVARAREIGESVSVLASAILLMRFALAAAVSVAVIAIAITAAGGSRGLWLASVLGIVGLTLQPTWYFQAVERMGWITLSSVLARGSYVIAVTLAIGPESDPALVVVIYGMSFLAAAGLGLFGMRKVGHRWARPSLSEGWRLVRKSASFFVSRVSIACYTAGATVYLGFAAGEFEAGRFAIAQQFYLVGQTAVSALVQALYPYMLRLRDYRLLVRIILSVTAGATGAAIAGILFGREALSIVYGTESSAAYWPTVIYLFVLPISGCSALLGYPLFGALGRLDIANRTVVAAGVLQIAWLMTLSVAGWGTATNVVLGVLAIEAFVLLSRIYCWRRVTASPRSVRPRAARELAE